MAITAEALEQRIAGLSESAWHALYLNGRYARIMRYNLSAS